MHYLICILILVHVTYETQCFVFVICFVSYPHNNMQLFRDLLTPVQEHPIMFSLEKIKSKYGEHGLEPQISCHWLMVHIYRTTLGNVDNQYLFNYQCTSYKNFLSILLYSLWTYCCVLLVSYKVLKIL